MSVKDPWTRAADFGTGRPAGTIQQLDPGALMLFGLTYIRQGEAIAPARTDAPRCGEARMRGRRTGVLMVSGCRAGAMRGADTGPALCSSAWVRRETGWRIVAHRQTSS